jgi:hypothetical protein
MMQATDLKTALLAMALVDDEAAAWSAWADAYRSYFAAAASNGVTAQAAGLVAAQSAMAAAMTGLKTSGAAAVQAGIVAFWGALVPTAVFPPSTIITPPAGLAGIAAQLALIFAANVAASADRDTSIGAIADALHTASSGGTATFPGSPPIVAPIA